MDDFVSREGFKNENMSVSMILCVAGGFERVKMSVWIDFLDEIVRVNVF